MFERLLSLLLIKCGTHSDSAWFWIQFGYILLNSLTSASLIIMFSYIMFCYTVCHAMINLFLLVLAC